MSKCNFEGCTKYSSFGYENNKHIRCKKHKDNDMINLNKINKDKNKIKKEEEDDDNIICSICLTKFEKIINLKNNQLYKTCEKCRNVSLKNKCEHKKQPSRCIKCGGSSICEHKKIKIRCVDCNGSQTCEHKKERKDCILCNGSGICIHKKRKNMCVDCNGSSICKHNKRKRYCVDCEGSALCIHKKQKYYCKECNFKLYLVNLQRKGLKRAINKSNTVKKSKSSIKYLGCSIEDFIEHIEKQMNPEMNWNNIHLDHIKPISKFNLDNEEEFLQCCNYKNFQPLLIEDNLKKSNKFSKEDEEEWIKLFI
jgi:hypothetical protein